MKRSGNHLLVSTLAVVIYASPARAEPTTKYVDFTLGVGHSTNPFLRLNDTAGSSFGRASARGVYAWRTERSLTNLTGFVEGSSYLKEYGLQSIFSVDGSHSYQMTEKVTLFGSVGASGDIAGQLSNRFLYVPPVVETPDDVPTLPPEIDDPALYSFSGRQYRFHAQAGAATRLSERSAITVSGGAARNSFTQGGLENYTTLFATAAFTRAMSERTVAGFSIYGSHSDYDGSGDYTAVVTPAATLSTRLSDNLEASGSIGVSISKSRNELVTDNSVDLAFNGSLCRTGATERLCGRLSRNAQSTARNSVTTATSATAEWFKKLDAKQTLQLSAGVYRYGGGVEAPVDQRLRETHVRAAASYSLLISERLSVGADAGIRGLRRSGPDPNIDVSGSVFLRYRLGDLHW